MIVKKIWIQQDKYKLREWAMEGWYLFGFIPLYIRDLTPRRRK